jgi:uncharacterized protein (TIGR02231 family)
MEIENNELLETIVLDASIKDVQVYKNGTKIVREGKAKLPAGDCKVILNALPSSIELGSVKVAKGKMKPRIKSMSIVDQIEKQDDKGDIDLLEKEIQSMEDEEAGLAKKIDFYQARKVDLLKLRESFLNEYPFALPEEKPLKFLLESGQDAFSFTPPKTTIDQFTGNVDEIIAGASEKLAQFIEQKSAIQDKVDALEKDLEQAKDKSSTKARKEIVFEVNSKKNGEFTFEIEYMLTIGSWEPVYDVFIGDETETMLIRLIAVVANETQEDWNNVMLTVSSTEINAVQIIEPKPWLLREAVAPTYHSPATAARQVSATAQAQPTTSMAASDLSEKNPALGRTPLEVAGSTAMNIITFALSSPITLKQGSGKHNIYLMEQELGCKAEYYYSTESGKLVVQNVVQNADTLFLAGDAKIYAGDSFIGEGRMNTVYPNEEFTIGTRDSQDLKIEKKMTNRSTDKGGMAKGRVVKYYSIDIEVEVLSDLARKNDLILLDKIPYSESELVKVNLTTSSDFEPEENKLNVLKWRISLGEMDNVFKVQYKYDVSYDKDVVIDVVLP